MDVRRKPRHRGLLVAMLLACSTFLLSCGGSQGKTFDSPRLQQIQANKKLVVGTALTPPFETRDPETGALVGFDVDLAKQIAVEVGVEIEWKEIAFADLVPQLQSGGFDLVIAAMYITPARQEVVDMSQPYVDTGLVIVTTTQNQAAIRTAADLNGRKVGVKKGATGAKFAEQLRADGNTLIIQEYTDTVDSLEDLSQGFVDAVLNDKINSIQYGKDHPEVVVSSEVLDPAGLGIAVRKGDADLLNLINGVVKRMRDDGSMDKLYAQWITQ